MFHVMAYSCCGTIKKSDNQFAEALNLNRPGSCLFVDTKDVEELL